MLNKILLNFAFCILSFGVLAQTQNYHGSSGALSDSTWSTNPAGPYTNNFVTTGGGVANFDVAGTMTGGSITVAGINANANKSLTLAGGTISNLSNGVIPIFVNTGVLLDFNNQAFTSASTAGYIKNGGGVLAMAGALYGGGFTLNAGTIIVRGVNAMGGAASNTLTLNGGIVASNANRDLGGKFGGGITVNGNVQFGDIVGLASPTANLSFNNNMNFGAVNRTLTMGNNGVTTFGGIISGTAGITFNRLSGFTGAFSINNASNVITGGFHLNGGEIRFANAGSTGGAGNTIVVDGGILASTANFSLDKAIFLGDDAQSSIQVASSTTLTITSSLSDKTAETGNLRKTGAGTLVINTTGLVNYTGNTLVQAGSIELAPSKNLPISTNLSLGAAGVTSLGTFNLGGNNQTIANLNSVTGTNTSASKNTITSSTPATLTVTGSGTYGSNTTQNSGIIAGAISLTKSGTGILTLADANTYTGTTTVSGGELNLARPGGGTIPAGSEVSVNSGTLRISSNQTLSQLHLQGAGTLIVESGVTLTISGDFRIFDNPTLTINGTIAYGGAGNLYYEGNGTRIAGAEWPNASVPNVVFIEPNFYLVINANRSRNTGTSLKVNGTLATNDASITGNGEVQIEGELITRNANGFIGSGASFTGASVVLSLGVNSTIHYGRDGDQSVQSFSPKYSNVTVSGSGVKTFISTQDTITGTVLIMNGATLNVGNNRFGSNSPAPNTKLKMEANSRFVQGFSGLANPSMSLSGADYDLAPSSTIEFSGTANVTIRSAVPYGNVEISGSNVNLNISGGITLKSGSTFTVKNGGVFKFQSIDGFSHGANTAVRNINSPTVVLEAGSTVEYARSGDQTVTYTGPTYHNLNISGSGLKTLGSTVSINGNLGLIGGTLVIPNFRALIVPSITAVSGNINGSATEAELVINQTSPLVLPANLFTSNIERFVINGADNVSTPTNITVSDALTLNGGDLVTLTGSKIILTSTANVFENAGQVLGTLETTRYVDIFHTELFGNMGLEITPSTKKMENTLVTRVTGQTLFGRGPACTHPSIQRYFEVSPDINNDLGATVILTYRLSDLTSHVESDLVIYKKPISAPCNDWVEVPSVIDIGLHNFTFNVNEFSVITAGDGVATPLPVKWLLVDAAATKDAVLVKWETASEINNSHFEVLRSTNGEDWETIGHVKGAGTTNFKTSYDYLDKFPKAGLNYYKLKQVDFDGQASFSKLIVVRFIQNRITQLFPNPAREVIQINTNGNVAKGLRIFTVSGQMVANHALQAGQNTVSLAGIARGFYLVEVQLSNNQSETHWIQILE